MLLIVWFKYQHMTQYNTNTQQVKIYDKNSLVELVAPNLWAVDQCFDINTYQFLKNIVELPGSEFVCSHLNKRLELKYSSAGFTQIEQIGQAMAATLGDMIDQPLTFMVAKYWLDLPTFGCQTHKDADDIFVSYQVYLDSSLRDNIRSEQHRDANIKTIEYLDSIDSDLMARGAKFLHVDPPVQIAFKPNHGYINLNSDGKLHRVDGSWDTRTSVMFQYSRV